MVDQPHRPRGPHAAQLPEDGGVRALDVEENLVIAGQMFTFPNLWSTFWIGPWRARRVAALRERARELIKIAGLWDVRHQPAGNLSGGQQKLIQFASMLMPEPKLILLDEPMAGINPEADRARRREHPLRQCRNSASASW